MNEFKLEFKLVANINATLHSDISLQPLLCGH